jgi:hypothetical protein
LPRRSSINESLKCHSATRKNFGAEDFHSREGREIFLLFALAPLLETQPVKFSWEFSGLVWPAVTLSVWRTACVADKCFRENQKKEKDIMTRFTHFAAILAAVLVIYMYAPAEGA